MVTRSTTSEFYPAPYGKTAKQTGIFRNGGRCVAIRASSSPGVRAGRNMSTAPLGRTGTALTGYTGVLTGLGLSANVTG